MTAPKPVTALVVNYTVVSSLLQSLREHLFGEGGCDMQEVKRMVGRLTVEIEGPKSQLAKSPAHALQHDQPDVAPRQPLFLHLLIRRNMSSTTSGPQLEPA